MNMPVLVDWLTLLLGPIVIISLVLSVFAKRSTSSAEAPLPAWGKVAQAVGMISAMLLGLLWILWGG
ncbi:hypothetical protein GCM10010191_88050 [Actinomadura vinacea]|uniref:Uncharacterized protein n=1 Tax=Actinomadura vinacea TaxID=115336 RepID=A0ABP5XNG4_9ACTN